MQKLAKYHFRMGRKNNETGFPKNNPILRIKFYQKFTHKKRGSQYEFESYYANIRSPDMEHCFQLMYANYMMNNDRR